MEYAAAAFYPSYSKNLRAFFKKEMAKLGLKDAKGDSAGLYVSNIIIRHMQYAGIACTFSGPSSRIKAPENEVMAIALILAKRNGEKIKLTEKEIQKRYNVSGRFIDKVVGKLDISIVNKNSKGVMHI